MRQSRVLGSSLRRAVRAAAALVGVAVLLVPSTRALAANSDPEPVDWPTVQKPDAGGNGADPAVVTWPTIKPPDGNSGSDNDPGPVDWPAPQKPPS